MIIPKRPTDLGLPAKFSEWRDNQLIALERALSVTKRFTVDCLPTGSGKTLYYIALAKLLGLRTAFVVSTKGLADQILEDFVGTGIRDIRGKANYECTYKPDYTCEDGHTGRCPLKGTSDCAFTKAYNGARTNPLVLTNYSFWISVHKYGLGLGKFDMVVFDEAHQAFKELASALQIRLSFREINELLGTDFPRNPESTTNAEWKIWANATRKIADQAVKASQVRIGGSATPKITWTREFNHLRNLVRKLATVALMRPADWIVEIQDWGFQFDPIRVGRYSESTLLLKIPRVVPISATIRPKTMYMLGVGEKDFDFMEHPSDFPPENSPIYIIPSQRVDYKHPDKSTMVLRMDQFIGAKRMDRKGAIHTVSYDLRDTLYRQSSLAHIFMSNFNEKETTSSVVNRFKLAEPPRALVSPSVGTGYDFSDDDARYNLICKIPFPDGRSKINKARQEEDKEYGGHVAASSLEQMCGRGTRSMQDWCENAIFDDNFIQWFLRRYQHFFTKNFLARCRVVTSIPPARTIDTQENYLL